MTESECIIFHLFFLFLSIIIYILSFIFTVDKKKQKSYFSQKIHFKLHIIKYIYKFENIF